MILLLHIDDVIGADSGELHFAECRL